MNTKQLSQFITSVATIITGGIFFLFPLLFFTSTTDFFTFPRQVLIILSTLLLLIIWGAKVIVDKRITIVTNPLNIPLLLFALVLILSTIFSVSPLDSILQSIPVVLLCAFFFTTVQFIQDRSSYVVVLTSFIIGGAFSALLSIFANFNIYLLPFEATKVQTFNTHGSPVQYAAFLIPLFILCTTSLITLLRKGKLNQLTKDYGNMLQIGATVIFAVGLIVVAYQIFSAPQKPILLPFNEGFQIALASISQDVQRMTQSLMLGSGYGTFATDFTRFVNPTFNTYPFWNLTFAYSSSFVLELLATTGFLGLFSYAYIFICLIKSKGKVSNPVFLASFAVFTLSLLLPFSYSMVFLLFAFLSLFVAYRNIENAKGFESISLNIVTLKKGFIELRDEDAKKKENLLLPIVFFTITIFTSVYILFFLSGQGDAARKGYLALIKADLNIAQSLTQKALQSGQETYNLQKQALIDYPYRSDYYRLFSKLNIALAANIVNAQQGKKPSPEVENNIVALLQQSINSARQAVTLSPYTAENWQNLGQIYRNLIGVGQNAEQFAIASYNQAITLSPTNPGLRIELGGIYLQLKQLDLAQNQFGVAAQLKNDYANAYFNLGHTLEEKGDLQNALNQYQIVQRLVVNDKTNLEKITADIKAVEDKIKNNQNNTAPQKEATKTESSLEVATPQSQFPTREPKEKIPAPPEAVVQPSESPTPSPTISPKGSR